MVTFPGLCISQFVKQVSSHFLPHDPPVSQLTKAEQILLHGRDGLMKVGQGPLLQRMGRVQEEDTNAPVARWYERWKFLGQVQGKGIGRLRQ